MRLLYRFDALQGQPGTCPQSVVGKPARKRVRTVDHRHGTGGTMFAQCILSIAFDLTRCCMTTIHAFCHIQNGV